MTSQSSTKTPTRHSLKMKRPVRESGRHVPESHPALQRLSDEQREDWSAEKRAVITHMIDGLARDLARIPDVPLTVLQARLMKVMARELMRRVKAA